MTFKKQLIGLSLALMLVPAVSFAQEKSGTVSAYDKESRMVTVKGKDWEQKAKVSSDDAKGKADLLKADTKVKVMFDAKDCLRFLLRNPKKEDVTVNTLMGYHSMY
jgi:hypothetical protein